MGKLKELEVFPPGEIVSLLSFEKRFEVKGVLWKLGYGYGFENKDRLVFYRYLSLTKRYPRFHLSLDSTNGFNFHYDCGRYQSGFWQEEREELEKLRGKLKSFQDKEWDPEVLKILQREIGGVLLFQGAKILRRVSHNHSSAAGKWVRGRHPSSRSSREKWGEEVEEALFEFNNHG